MGFMWRVSAGGGDREEILTNRYDVRYGEVFPDGDHVFASRYSESSSGDYADVYVQKKGKKGLSKNKIAVIFASGDIGMAIGDEGIDGEKLAREIRKVRQERRQRAR